MGREATGLAAALLLCLAPVACSVQTTVEDTQTPLPPGRVRFSGWLGAQLETCRQGRMLGQSIPDLVEPFRQREETRFWQSEFWGKWFTSAALACRYQPDPALQARLDEAVTELLKTQTPDGYIGNYKPEAQTQQWDLWGRKYVLLGLLAYHDLTGDPRALAAAVREADYTLGQVGPGKADIAACGNWSGMAAGSILEPMVLLYRRTGDRRYLDFANHIVARWEAPEGPGLVRKALAGTAVFDMFPSPQPSQKGYIAGGQSKAYEMMSCYEGLLELHRVTGQPGYAEAAKRVAASIRDTEITLVGSGSDWERWCRGRMRQAEPVKRWMETCVSATWIKLNAQLLRLTGDPQYADAIEQAAYNALCAAQKSGGTWWCHYSPLEGSRQPAPEQCKMHMNCCVASGPRALMLLPALAVMASPDGPVVNLYEPATADTGAAKITIGGGYPRPGAVTLAVDPPSPAEFTLSLRIPAWSRNTRVCVNGEPAGDPEAGTYLRLARTWRKGDTITVQFDFTTRLARDPGGSPRLAVTHGPLVMAIDRRVTPPRPDSPPSSLAAGADGCLNALPVAGPLPAGVLVALEVPVAAADGRTATLRMCDYASAGSTWDESSQYRVWLPQPLDLAAPFADIPPPEKGH